MLSGELDQPTLSLHMQRVDLSHKSSERRTDLLTRSPLQSLLRQPAFSFDFAQHAVDHRDDFLRSIFGALNFGDHPEDGGDLSFDRDEIVVLAESLGLIFGHCETVAGGKDLLFDEFAGLPRLLFFALILVLPIHFGELISQTLRQRWIGIDHRDHQNIRIALLFDVDTVLHPLNNQRRIGERRHPLRHPHRFGGTPNHRITLNDRDLGFDLVSNTATVGF